jgi:hypothetical protein
MPRPPRVGWGVPFWVSPAVLLSVSAGLALVDIVQGDRALAFDQHHPLLILGSFFGAVATLVLIVFLAVFRGTWRPGTELVGCPLLPGVPVRLAFVAASDQVHGVWLNVDVVHDTTSSSYELVTALRAWTAHRLLVDGRSGLRWTSASLRSSAVAVPPGDTLAGVGPVVRILDRRMEAVPGVPRRHRYRGLVLLWELHDLRPGDPVTVDVVLEPPVFGVLSLGVEAFVAAPAR